MNRFLDTQKIPRKSKNRYDWKQSVGCELFFQYDTYSGYIKIKDYILKDNYRHKLLIDINGKEKEINPYSLIKLDIGDLLGVFTHDFKYEIGCVFGKGNNKIKIISRYRNHSKMYHVQCLKCGYEKDMKESRITRNEGCPVCLNQIIVDGINDMWTTNPELSELLAYPDDGHKYAQHSNKKLIWKCPICNSKTKPLSPDYISRYGLYCQKCGDGFSYPNKFIFNLLTEFHIDFTPEKTFNWSDHRIYDFYLPKHNWIIEAHGMQHYQDNGYFYNLTDVQNNDVYKENLAIKNGIKNYIVVDCRYSKPDYIFQNICNSDLINIIDITKADVDYVDKLCQKNIMSDIVDLYNKNYDTNRMEKQLKISKSQICRLLNKADSLGLINYNKYKFKQESTAKAQSTLYQNYAKPIKCLKNGYVFGSYTIAAHNSDQVFGRKIRVGSICNAINSNKTIHGYKFVFISREEFNNTKMVSPYIAFGDYFKCLQCKSEVT